MLHKILQNGTILLAVLTLAVLASRLPFLSAGYSSDPDGWGIILAAQQTAQTGVYHTSRFPCYPVPELLYVPIHKAGPFWCNFVTAVLSSFAFMFFVLILRHYRCRDAVLGGLALAFTPIIYIHSCDTMDYIWALCFILGGMYFILCNRPILAGIMLGLAVGCRITSGAMWLPMIIMLPVSKEKTAWKSILLFSLSAGVAGFLVYLPVFLNYGLKFFSFYNGMGFPEWDVFWKRVTAGVWGPIGANSLFIALAAAIFFHKDNSIPQTSDTTRAVASWITALVLYYLAFLRLPHEAGYLIPVVPFVILMFAKLSNRRVFQFLCVALIASSFITIYRSWIHFNGPIFNDRLYRLNYDEKAQNILDLTKSYPPKSVIITGAFQPMVMVKANAAEIKTPEYVYLLDETQIKQYISDGYSIYYIAEEREANRNLFGADPAAFGAKSIKLDVIELP